MRQPTYTPEVAAAAEDLVRQEPPAEQGRATWTLHDLSAALADRFHHLKTVSHEAVRRLLEQRDIDWRQAKEWLTSPDPLYTVRKHQRDRLLALARGSPEGAAIWLDQSWFVRWPYRYWAWALQDEPPRVAKRWAEEVDTTALYAALDDETQEAYLHWATGQPNSQETVAFLDMLMAQQAQRDLRFVALLWDKGSWHTSKQTRRWIRDYNRRAKREGLPRLIVCYLPTRSPWLMPLEAIFGYVKHQVLGGRRFETVSDLQATVEHYFRQRVAEAKARRDRTWSRALAVAA